MTHTPSNEAGGPALTPETLAAARILIVDDQETNVAMLTALLYQAGYTALKGITDPRATADAFVDFAPDLVLLDLVMPHLDGFGVMARLRPLIPAGSFVPILVLTAELTPEIRRQALADGATDFLTKPLDTTEVRLRIRNLLHTRALHLSLQGQNERLEAMVAERTHALQARTEELEEARGQILDLYRELARRNQELHDLLGRLLQTPSEAPRRAALAVQEGAVAAAAIERLTPREQEVLTYVAQGQTNADIARALVVSSGTVKTHVEHIIAKLGVADRTQAAVRAVELGFLAARVLTTVLFTDIVGSTERAAALGDRAWLELKQRHHAVIRRELARFHGEEIDTAGDGFLAAFDVPERAVRCACAVRDAVRPLGLDIRVGLHTGEVERQGAGVTGIAVHIGRRVEERAGPGEVLVSSTVRDLAAGSGLPFADRGLHTLKGVPGEWRLFAVAL
jgi:DNA-binding NarL/FixJ family response regulator